MERVTYISAMPIWYAMFITNGPAEEQMSTIREELIWKPAEIWPVKFGRVPKYIRH